MNKSVHPVHRGACLWEATVLIPTYWESNFIRNSGADHVSWLMGEWGRVGPLLTFTGYLGWITVWVRTQVFATV